MLTQIYKEIIILVCFLKSLFKTRTNLINCYVFAQNQNSGGGLKANALKAFFKKKYAPNILYFISSDLPKISKILIFLGKMFQLKIVLNQNGIYFPAWYSGDCKKQNKRYKYLLKHADYLIFQSKFCKKMLEKEFPNLIKNKPTSIIYNYFSNRINETPPPQEKTLKICVAGTHNFPERILKAYEVCRNLSKKKKVFFGIHGSIPQSVYLKISHIFVKKNNRFVCKNYGCYSNSQIGTILKRYNFLIHAQPLDCSPSLILESIAAGLPFIAQNNGGIPELCGDKYMQYLIETKSSNNKYNWGSTKQYVEKINQIQKKRSLILPLLKTQAKYFTKKSFIKNHYYIFDQILR